MNQQITPFEQPEYITKAAIQDYSDYLIKQLEDGLANPMDMALRLKFMEELIDKMKERLRSLVIDELGKYTKGEDIIRHNGQFKAKETGVRYDFTGCNDPLWNRLNQEIVELTDKRKEREAMLKTIKEKQTIIDEETGEIANLFPARKLSTSSYEIRWKH
jgi:hypothetical protein